jgi:hypothetical protein
MEIDMPACPKCQGDMEAGFIPDFSYGTILQSNWFAGDAEKSWRGSIKTSGKRQIVITTDRCTKCGYLESYARP